MPRTWFLSLIPLRPYRRLKDPVRAVSQCAKILVSSFTASSFFIMAPKSFSTATQTTLPRGVMELILPQASKSPDINLTEQPINQEIFPLFGLSSHFTISRMRATSIYPSYPRSTFAQWRDKKGPSRQIRGLPYVRSAQMGDRGKNIPKNADKQQFNQMGREALEGLRISPKPAACRKINKRIISHPITQVFRTEGCVCQKIPK